MQRIALLLFIAAAFLLTACDPMAQRPTRQVIVVSLTATAAPTISATPSHTRTLIPTETPDFTPTPTPFPCEDDGQILEISQYQSDAARENLPYHVYLPPCYAETQQRYPVLFLLHGLAERQSQWADLGIERELNQGIRLGILPPMIVVMPYYGNIGTRNRFPPDPSYETVLVEELLPRIELNFCVWEDRDYRAIGGISRGGFWAYSIAMRHPDLFSIAGSHSGVYPENIPAANNPLEIARNNTLLPEIDLRLYLDNGARDDAGISQQTLSDRLRTRAIPHTYIINPVGGHDADYWSAHISEYLDFYGETWPRNYSSLPSCLEPSP